METINRTKTNISESKEKSSNSSLISSMISRATKNLDSLTNTLICSKEKVKSETASITKIFKLIEDNYSKFIDDIEKNYEEKREKINSTLQKHPNLEDLNLNERNEINQIFEECSKVSNFFKIESNIKKEIQKLEELKDNMNLKDYIRRCGSLINEHTPFQNETNQIDNSENQSNFFKIFEKNQKLKKSSENLEEIQGPSLLATTESTGDNIKHSKNKKSENSSKAPQKCEEVKNVLQDDASSTKSEKFAHKYTQMNNIFESPSSAKMLNKKRHKSSDDDVESTNTNNHEDIDLAKESEENCGFEKGKKNPKKTEEKTQDFNGKNNSKKNYKFSMKREISALGLNGPKVKKPKINPQIENSHIQSKIPPQQIMDKSSNLPITPANPSCSEPIDLINSNTVNSQSNSHQINLEEKITKCKPIQSAINIPNNPSASIKNSKEKKSKLKAIDKLSAPIIISQEGENQKKQSLNPATKESSEGELAILKSDKFVECNSELNKNLQKITNIVGQESNIFTDHILKNLEDCLFKTRVFYCEFDMLNKNKKFNFDHLAKDLIFSQNLENYEYVKLTIVRKGKQNINNLLKSMENFFKQYIKRKDIDGSAIIKGTINCSFDKLQKYFTMQMRSFEYCEAIQLEVYMFKWDLFYDYNEKEDKTNLDKETMKQYIQNGSLLKETRILMKKRNLMLNAINSGSLHN